jgi:hypothetical protein
MTTQTIWNSGQRNRMRRISLLLPPPGNEVVIDCLDQIELLQQQINQLEDSHNKIFDL